jgi:hypothetical protein
MGKGQQYKSFLLRMNKRTLEALQGWARDDLRSLNAQIEWILRDGLRRNGRLPKQTPSPGGS